MATAFSSSETEVIERQIENADSIEEVPIEQIWTRDKCDKLREWLKEKNLQRICLQFPDHLLHHSVAICEQLQDAEPERQFFILADTTYCPCCVDSVGAEHVQADGLVHFGHACLSKTKEGLLVFYCFREQPLDVATLVKAIETEITDKDQKLAVFYSTDYVHEAKTIGQQLIDTYPNALIGELAVDREARFLGWHVDGDLNFDDYQCLYIGADDQHFFNLSVSLNAQRWLLYNPCDGPSGAICKEVAPQSSKWLRKRYFFIEKCKDAQCLGIVHGTVSSDGHLEVAKRIQALAKAQNIRTVSISVGKLNPAKLANFMDIDCFVVIGCPENAIHTSRDYYKPLVSVFECELALNPLWRNKMPDTYAMGFCDLLPQGKHYTDVAVAVASITGDESDISLITGRVRGVVTLEADAVTNGETSLMATGKNEIVEHSAGDALRNRSWRGLEQSLGQTPVAEIEEGRSGIPIKYDENVAQ